MSPAPARDPVPEQSLDPSDWVEFRNQAHEMLEAAIDKMQANREGRVWTEFPADLKADFQDPLPKRGLGTEATRLQMQALLPYGVGNTHPRFFGWVHGSGTPGNMIAEIAAAALNANLGGRDHGAMYVEKQVVNWCRELFEFPATASGLIVSGTSVATIIALKAARDRCFDFTTRKRGLQNSARGQLVGYTSAQTHSCVARAFDILGLGSDALRKIAVNDRFEIDSAALQAAITKDRAAGLTPFAIIGTAGAVNVGAIDDLDALADIADAERLWFHIDGAFGAFGVLSERLRGRLGGIKRADSLAFDFHKWLHVNYDAGFVLMRSDEAHRRTFSERPEYLKGAERGLAAGNPWPVEYGPGLSRGFRALKVWAQIAEHGTDKLGALITQNCEQAAYLADLVTAHVDMEVVAPVAMNICCFRRTASGLDPAAVDALNDEIVVRLQLEGIAAPSTTLVNGRNAIRVNITNHRTTRADLALLVREVHRIALDVLAAKDLAVR
ncbi:MAG: pyridoxal-dependent decarboxylase [Rhizobacter sp.]|nr:pyridoxal-dependent decarboxylase [Rhizobacter sp.]